MDHKGHWCHLNPKRVTNETCNYQIEETVSEPEVYGFTSQANFIGWEFRVYMKEEGQKPRLVYKGFAFRYLKAEHKLQGAIAYLSGRITHKEWTAKY